jgi:hypothetical protein
MKIIFYIPILVFLSTNIVFGQTVNVWSDYMVMWQCKSDTSLKLMYRVNIGEDGRNSFVEMIGPDKMDSVEIFGTLKIQVNHTDGSFTASETKNEKIDIKEGYFSKQYVSDFNNINQISFEGDCLNLKKLFGTKLKIEKDSINQPYRIKRKQPVISGVRG